MNNSRGTFGPTFAIARAAALVLHVDVALILLRMYRPALPTVITESELTGWIAVCRTLISWARQTPLNGIIQFGKTAKKYPGLC